MVNTAQYHKFVIDIESSPHQLAIAHLCSLCSSAGMNKAIKRSKQQDRLVVHVKLCTNAYLHTTQLIVTLFLQRIMQSLLRTVCYNEFMRLL